MRLVDQHRSGHRHGRVVYGYSGKLDRERQSHAGGIRFFFRHRRGRHAVEGCGIDDDPEAGNGQVVDHSPPVEQRAQRTPRQVYSSDGHGDPIYAQPEPLQLQRPHEPPGHLLDGHGAGELRHD